MGALDAEFVVVDVEGARVKGVDGAFLGAAVGE